MTWIWPFLIYWFILFVITYIITEYGHRYLYDELPKLTPVRVLVASLILAAMLTWTHSSLETMFTSDIKWTVLQAIIWSGVYVVVLTFQPLHGALMGLAAMVVVAGMSTIAVDSMTKPKADPRTQFTTPNAPVRRSSGGIAPATKPEVSKEAAAKPEVSKEAAATK